MPGVVERRHMTGPFVPTAIAAATLDVATALLLQAPGAADVSVGTTPTSVAGGAIGAFLTTLLVGVILVAVAPEYTEIRMAQVLDDPVGTFVYGVVALVFVVLVSIVLVLSIIGVIVAVPFAIRAWVLWAAGSVVAFLAVADRLVGHEDGWTTPLVVAAGLNGLLAVTGIGGVVSFCVGAAGFGAVLRSSLG